MGTAFKNSYPVSATVEFFEVVTTTTTLVATANQEDSNANDSFLKIGLIIAAVVAGIVLVSACLIVAGDCPRLTGRKQVETKQAISDTEIREPPLVLLGRVQPQDCPGKSFELGKLTSEAKHDIAQQGCSSHALNALEKGAAPSQILSEVSNGSEQWSSEIGTIRQQWVVDLVSGADGVQSFPTSTQEVQQTSSDPISLDDIDGIRLVFAADGVSSMISM